jgi:mandelamide amidase
MSDLSRRGFLVVSGGAAAAGVSGCAMTPPPPLPPPAGPIVELSASEAAAQIKAGGLTAERYAEALIARTAACQPTTNAYVTFNADALRAAARAADQARARNRPLGPLHGVPLVLKDNINTRGVPTSGGTRALAKNVPRQDAPVWARLARAGALLAGKAGMHELAFGITNNNGVFGPVKNPYDPRMIPGGSSGGTGAAVGARMAPAGLGSDTGGSVRIPAALCGLHGLRPTIGRWPQTGIVPISWTRDTAGPMARSLDDLALINGLATTGAHVGIAPADLKLVRLGVPRAYFWENLDPETQRICEGALARLRAAGATLVEVGIPDIGKLNDAVSFPVALWEVMRALPRYLRAYAPGVGFREMIAQVGSPDVKGVLESQLTDKAVPTKAYQAAVGPARARLRAAYRAYFRANDLHAMVFPTTPLPARPIGQDQTVELNGKQVPTFPTFIRNTDPGSNAGIPGLSVAVGLTRAGLPVGLEFDGPWDADSKLLVIGAALERLTGKLPPPRSC